MAVRHGRDFVKIPENNGRLKSPRLKRMLFAVLAAVLFTGFAAEAPALCVSAPEANLRSGPGTNHEKLWEVFKYMPLKRLDRKGLWYRVKDLDGDVYWVYAPLVTGKYQCAVVRDDKANVRSGAGLHFKQTSASPAMKYYSFKVLKIKGSWVNVMDEYGAKGWIYKPLLWIQ